jgi:hypothetical protein
MTYEELKRKASYGPLEVCSPIDRNATGLDVAYTRCWIRNDAERNEKTVLRQPPGIGATAGDREATALLLAHRFNRFDEAVEMLKETRSVVLRESRVRVSGELGELYLRDLLSRVDLVLAHAKEVKT